MDTIVALSTPIGVSAISVIRMSGEKSLEIKDKVFVPINKNSPQTPKVLYRGYFIDNLDNIKLDDILMVFFRAPNSYTGEDMVEFHMHGGLQIISSAMEVLIKNGARIADRGEFTLRSFLNGKMNLLQAEAVAELIYSKSKKGLSIALNHLQGGLNKKIFDIKNKIYEIFADLEVVIDFPEDIIHSFSRDEIKMKILNVINTIKFLIDSFRVGKTFIEGIKVGIVGSPNVGKSSIMNRLLKSERVIVSSIPGTTRDVVSENLSLCGCPITLFDTAGFCNSLDEIEIEGIKRSKSVIENSDLIFFVIDSSRHFIDNDLNLLDLIKDKKFLVIFNKIDLKVITDENSLKNFLPDFKYVKLSALTGEGFSEIEKYFEENFIYNENDSIITNERHKNALVLCNEFLKEAYQLIDFETLDIVSISIKSAIKSLNRLIGEDIEENLVSEIFNRFCVGK